MKRRTLLHATAGGLLAAPAFVHRANAQSQFDWKQYKGEKLEVALTLGPRATVLMQHQKEFEELTGIRVGAEAIPEQQNRQKIAIEFASGRTSFDVFTLSLHVQKRMMARAGWLEDLRPWLNDPARTPAEYDWSDMGKGGVDYVTTANGRIEGLPLNLDYWMLYWNKELFQQKGLAYPKSIDELVSHARTLTDPSKGIYGFVGRGLKNANIPVWTSWLLGQGKETVENGVLQTDTREAVWAGEIYKTLMKDTAPPGSVGFNWNESQTTFSQGRAAMWLDGIGFSLPLVDPTKSRVVGKVGFGVTPPGPKARHSALFGDSVAIPASGRKKGPAYLYAMWATSKPMALRMLTAGAGTPARISAYQNPAAMRDSKFGQEWFDCVVESVKIARPGLPEIIPVTEFRDTFGVALTNTIGGADVAAELRKATEAFKPVLDKSEQS